MDRPVGDPAAREEMASLAQGRNGIPAIRSNGEALVGVDRSWLTARLGLG